MTQDPALSADRVAALEKKLADAAAEMAKVRAELAQARQATPPPPAGTPVATDLPSVGGTPGATVPVVPYGAAQIVNPADLQAVAASQLSPQAMEQPRQVMSRLGLEQTIGHALGMPVSPPNPPSPTSVSTLADPPRPVPMTYRLATFDFSWIEMFSLFLVGVTPIALWSLVPASRPIGLVVVAALVIAFRVRRYVRRTRILKWGRSPPSPAPTSSTAAPTTPAPPTATSGSAPRGAGTPRPSGTPGPATPPTCTTRSTAPPPRCASRGCPTSTA